MNDSLGTQETRNMKKYVCSFSVGCRKIYETTKKNLGTVRNRTHFFYVRILVRLRRTARPPQRHEHATIFFAVVLIAVTLKIDLQCMSSKSVRVQK
jgi:hypothetical protein